MDSRYLCRAKRIDNGELVEGFYFCMIHDDGRHIHHFIMPLGEDLSLDTPIEKIQVEVDPSTICYENDSWCTVDEKTKNAGWNACIDAIGGREDIAIMHFESAIKALEELKQIKENGAFTGVELAQLAAMQMKLKEYQSIGTTEECQAAMEKQNGKRPIRNDKCTCPSCGTHNEVIKKRRNTVAHDIVYCWHCGQAMEIDRLEV